MILDPRVPEINTPLFKPTKYKPPPTLPKDNRKKLIDWANWFISYIPGIPKIKQTSYRKWLNQFK